jgi:hypothetical protein
MYVPVLFACPMCAMQTPFMFALAFCIGGVLVSYLLLKPYTSRISAKWGWPRLEAVRCIALLPLLAWPCLFCLIGLQNHVMLRVVPCATGLVLCVVYAWLRGSWLLQQCSVAKWFRQFLFLSVFGPGTLIVGTLIGYAIVGLVFLGISWPSMAFSWFLPPACIGSVLWILLYGGFVYTFQDDSVPAKPQKKE